MLGFILFSILFAHFPNRRVERLTSKSSLFGERQRMSSVLEWPPREDLRILVRGEFQ